MCCLYMIFVYVRPNSKQIGFNEILRIKCDDTDKRTHRAISLVLLQRSLYIYTLYIINENMYNIIRRWNYSIFQLGNCKGCIYTQGVIRQRELEVSSYIYARLQCIACNSAYGSGLVCELYGESFLPQL